MKSERGVGGCLRVFVDWYDRFFLCFLCFSCQPLALYVITDSVDLGGNAHCFE